VAGELFIGGAGVVRGYRGRAELSAERFLPDPFAGEPGARMYRTGDLARYRADGTVEFLGRIDHQVKVRGYRIELGEIESLLRKHSAVRDAVVVLREDTPGDKRLVAYVVAEPGQTPSVAELRAYAKERLPEFMVPATAVLPTPDHVAAARESAYVSPENDLEARIAKIWQDVLKTPQVGALDNFFDLGGHSLLIVQVLARVREALGRHLPMTDLFRFPTIRSLAQHLASGGDDEAALEASQDRGAARREQLQRRRAQRRKP
jgi:acyl carrier protein